MTAALLFSEGCFHGSSTLRVYAESKLFHHINASKFPKQPSKKKKKKITKNYGNIAQNNKPTATKRPSTKSGSHQLPENIPHWMFNTVILNIILNIANCSLSTHHKEGSESKPSVALASRGGISQSFLGQSLTGNRQQIFGRGFCPAVDTNRLTMMTPSLLFLRSSPYNSWDCVQH